MRGTPFLFKGFTGGLNTIASPYELEPNETRECLNVVSTERGAIKKRYGSTLFTAAPPNVELDSLHPVAFPAFNDLLATGGGKIYAINVLGESEEIGKGFTAGARWSIVQAPKSTAVASEGPIYLSNGVDKPQQWNGAGEVKEWKGVSSSPKLTDGVIAEKGFTLKSASAGFISSDVGLIVKFETEVKSGGKVIGEATIESVISATEVKLAIPEVGWDASKAAVHFTLERSFYATEPHVPNGQFQIFAGNRIWMTGIKSDPSAVWFSELVSIGEGGSQADPSQWPTTNVVRFDSSDGYPITGIGTVGPYILIFKENKTWAIHNLNTGENRKISDDTGCIAQRSILETDNGTYFLTSDSGVYITNGSGVKEVSYNVRPTIMAINPKQRQNAAAAYFANHYYLSYASGSSETNNRTLDLDTVLKSWWLHDLTGNEWVVWEASVPGPAMLYTIPPGTKKGVVKAFVEGVYQDVGTNYKGNGTLGAFWLGPWDPFAYYVFRHRIEAPFIKKRVRQIFFNGEGQIIPLVYKNFSSGSREEPATVGNDLQTKPELPTNFNAASENWAEGGGSWATEVPGTEVIWGGETSVGAARIYAPGVASVWSIGFGNNSAEPFVVNAYMLSATFRKS